ncbi:hypothetical protein Tco_0436172 [Tanacetum coccineum]
MEKCDTVSTPMATTKLDADLQGTRVDQTKCRSMIGGLMYLTASRPDIAFATFVCARYQARPTDKHLKEMQTMQGVMMIAKAHPEAFNFWEISYHLDENATAGLWISFQQDFDILIPHDSARDPSSSTCSSITNQSEDATIMRYALTVTADVPVVYLQQFWRMASKVPDTKDTIKFLLNTKQFTYTVDMFCDILQLPVETLENLFVTPANIHTIEAFMNRVGYQGVVDKLFHAVVNQTHIDYVALLWWDFMNNVFQKKEAIQYPRFIKLIIADLMKKFPNIPKRIEEDYHSIKDDALFIRETDAFKEYEMVFMKTARESSLPRKSLKITIKQKQIVEQDDDDSEVRIEPESHKENPEIVDDDNDDKNEETQNDDMGSLEIRNEETRTTIPTPSSSPRKVLSSDKIIDQELKDIVSIPTTSISQHSHVKKQISSKYSHLPGALRRMCRRQVPSLFSQESNAHALAIIEELFKNYVQSNIVHIHPTTFTSIETDSSAALQYQLYLKEDDFHSQHDEHQDDDAPLEGEKRVKRRKGSKRSKSARGSSSKHSSKDSTRYVSKQQSQQQEWDAWEEENFISEDEVIPKDETPELIVEF